MRAGKLDQVIEIRRPSWVDDGFGTQVPGPTSTVATVRAQVLTSSLEEFFRSWGAATESATVFRIRWVDGVSLVDQIRHAGVDFDIKEIKEIGRRRGLELRCVAR